jgi:hypothetical protein
MIRDDKWAFKLPRKKMPQVSIEEAQGSTKIENFKIKGLFLTSKETVLHKFVLPKQSKKILHSCFVEFTETH